MNIDVRFNTWESAVRWLRDQPDQQDLVRAAFYDDPLAVAASRYWQSTEWREIQILIGGVTGRSALDLGAGRGIASYALALDGFTVTALEPDPSELVGAGAIRSLAVAERLDIRVVEGVSETLPFPEASFDIAIARAVLHHAADLRKVCGEVFRVLRPGGVLLAIREHVLSRPEHLPRFLEAHPLHRLYGGEYAYVEADYCAALQGAGFAVTTLRSFDSPINYFPYTKDTLRDKLIDAVKPGPVLRRIIVALLSRQWAFNAVLRILSRADRRPGRLYSFICRKPA